MLKTEKTEKTKDKTKSTNFITGYPKDLMYFLQTNDFRSCVLKGDFQFEAINPTFIESEK